MRVAILAQFPIHTLPEFSAGGHPGGHYATWLPQLARSFSNESRIEVHWIAMSTLVQFRRDVIFANQQFHILPTSTSKRATSLFASDRRAINAVLAEIRPDLVHGWGTEDVYALAAVTSGYPNIVSLQGILSYYALRTRMHPREYLQAVMELWILNKADRLTTESAWGQRILHRIAPGKPISLVEYGVQHCFLDYPWAPDAACPSALFIGSVAPRKGIQDAVEAFRNPALAGAQLRIAGGAEGKWAESLRRSSTPNVKWLGRLGPEDTAKELSRSWCLVLPTRADTSPNVVKEARVIGLPVITTPCGGQTTYIQDGQSGFLVRPGDVRGLTEKLALLLGSLETARRHGAIDHEKHRHILHPDRTAEGFLKVYGV